MAGAPAYLNRVVTAIPDNDVHAAFINFARTSLITPRERRIFDRLEERSGINHRFSTLVPGSSDGLSIDVGDFYRRGCFPSTAQRMAVYEREATRIAAQAVRRLNPTGITHLVVASCTGLTAPGLDQRLATSLKLGNCLQRTFVGFMGCYATVPAMRVAADAVRADPTARVLVVSLELCTLHLQESADLQTMLSFLIFGDGCYAALVTADPYGLSIGAFRSINLPGTEELITWRIGDHGFDMHLDGQVPAAIGTALRGEAGRNVAGLFRDLDIAATPFWAVHGGGRTILDAVESGLDLPSDALRFSRAVLRDVGNVSSATLGFVLARMLDAPESGSGIALAFGPGLCAETFRFHKAA